MAKIYVTVKPGRMDGNNARLRVGKLPFLKRTVRTGHFIATFEKFGIPINKRLIVSDEAFPGSSKLDGNGSFSGSYTRFDVNTYLAFCGTELKRYFKSIPNSLHWKEAKII